MVKRLVIFSVLACFILVITGCATIMSGLRQEVVILSRPVGASVTIDGRPQGKTPLVLDLERKDDHYIRLEMDGYEPYEVTVTRKINGWVWGNVLIGGLIGLAIDYNTGGLFNLTPDDIRPSLEMSGIGHLYKEDTLYVATVLEPDPSWHKIGSMKPIRVD